MKGGDAKFSDLRLVGDEVHLDGELVAVLATTCSATAIGRFTDLLEFGEPEDENEKCECPPRLHKSDCGMHKAEDGEPGDANILSLLRRFARGGLVRVVDIEKALRKGTCE